MSSHGPVGDPRGSFEIDAEAGADARKFAKKVPQTSVSPTYKLTLPADYVQLHLSHLIGQEIEVTDHTGAQFWDVVIQPRRNKDKYEYTLQGWKAFAKSNKVQAGDRLEFFLLSEATLQIRVVKRALYKDRLVAHENLSCRGSDAFRDDEGNTGSEGTDQGSSEPHTPKAWGISGSHSALARAGGSGASADTPHAVPWLPPLGSMGPAMAGPSSELPVLNQLIDLRPLTFEDHGSDSLSGLGRVSLKEEDLSLSGRNQGQAEQLGMLGHPGGPAWGFSHGQDPESSKRKRRDFQDSDFVLRSASSASAWPTQGGQEGLLRKNLGLRLLSSAAEEKVPRIPGEAGELQERLERANSRAQRAEMEAASLVQVMGTMEGLLEQQTARGLATVGALMHIANRLISPELLTSVDPPVAQELASIQVDLKHHMEIILETMCHLRNLIKHGHGSILP